MTRAIALVLGGAALAACAASHAPDGAPPDAGLDAASGLDASSSMTAEELLAELRAVRCDRAARCEAYDGEDLAAHEIAALCHPDGDGSHFRWIDEDEVVLARLRCDEIAFHPRVAERCLDAVRALPCGTFARDITEETAVCADVFRRVDPETTCLSGDCVPPEVCAVAIGDEARRDAPRACRPPRALGEPCTLPSSPMPGICAEGLFCRRIDADAGVCEVERQLGEPCVEDLIHGIDGCARDLWCPFGTCDVRVAAPGRSVHLRLPRRAALRRGVGKRAVHACAGHRGSVRGAGRLRVVRRSTAVRPFRAVRRRRLRSAASWRRELRDGRAVHPVVPLRGRDLRARPDRRRGVRRAPEVCPRRVRRRTVQAARGGRAVRGERGAVLRELPDAVHRGAVRAGDRGRRALRHRLGGVPGPRALLRAGRRRARVHRRLAGVLSGESVGWIARRASCEASRVQAAKCVGGLRAELDTTGEHVGGTHSKIVVLKDLFPKDVALVRSGVGAARYAALEAEAAAASERIERERPSAFDGSSKRVPIAQAAVCIGCWRSEIVEIEESFTIWRTCKNTGLGAMDVAIVLGVLFRNLAPLGLTIPAAHELPASAIHEIDQLSRARLGKKPNLEWKRLRGILERSGVDVSVS